MTDARHALSLAPSGRLRQWYWHLRASRSVAWATRHYSVPEVVLDRFLALHPEVVTRKLPLVGAALMQWVRLEDRWPRQHMMPSLAVRSVAQILAADEATWDDCARALGTSLSLDFLYPPVNRPSLNTTLRHAQEDESTVQLPLLFRVDHESQIRGGHTYLTSVRPDVSHICPPGVICVHYQGPSVPGMPS
jgi:hypothetical protein